MELECCKGSIILLIYGIPLKMLCIRVYGERGNGAFSWKDFMAVICMQIS